MNITHNLTIKATDETIYKAVATEEGIQGWWSKECSVGETEGEKSRLKFNKAGKIVTMAFRTWTLTPYKKVIWECTENANPAWIGTKISTEIMKSGEGHSEVVFSHADFDEKWEGQEPFEMTKIGWEHFVDSLVSYCENGQGQPW